MNVSLGKTRYQYLHILLLVIILIGISVRFYQLDAHFLNGDEEFYIVAAQKFHAGSEYDVRIWNYHSPPVAKYLGSLPLAFTEADYSVAYSIPPNLFVYNYLAYESIGSVYPVVRTVSAVFGVLLVVFLFLIGKELFGTTAGLVAAASGGIAIDLIMLSRVVMVDIFLYAFMASALYFYIKYRNSSKPIPYLLGFFISVILMLGSKNLQSLIILPPVLYVEIVGNRKNILKTINFLIILGFAWFVHNTFIYPPEISDLAYEFFTSGQASQLLYVGTIPQFIISLFTINSVFYLAVFLLTIVFLAKRVSWQKVKRHLISPTPYTLILLLAAFSLVVFAFSTLNQNSKYVSQMTIPFILLGGLVTQRYWNKKTVRIGLLLLLVISAASVVVYFPTYEGYPGQQVISFSSPHRITQPQLDLLKEMGNPPIITNFMNILLFYEGQALAIPPVNSPACTPEFLIQLQEEGFVGVFRNVGEVEKGFLCGQVFSYGEEIETSSDNVQMVRY